MSAQLDNLGARKVGCLEPGCSTTWNFDFIKKYLPADAMEKYNTGMLNAWKESVNLHTCVDEKCGAIGLVDGMTPGYPQVVCNGFKVRFYANYL